MFECNLWSFSFVLGDFQEKKPYGPCKVKYFILYFFHIAYASSNLIATSLVQLNLFSSEHATDGLDVQNFKWCIVTK